MTPVIVLIVAVVALLVLDLLALTLGVDSRPGFEDPRAPAGGIN